MRNYKIVLTCIMLPVVLILQGCGHKGPLYLPKKPTTPVQAEQKK